MPDDNRKSRGKGNDLPEDPTDAPGDDTAPRKDDGDTEDLPAAPDGIPAEDEP